MPQPKQKVAYLSTYWLDYDDVDIELYVFWGAATMCEVTEHVRSCSRTISQGQGHFGQKR